MLMMGRKVSGDSNMGL